MGESENRSPDPQTRALKGGDGPHGKSNLQDPWEEFTSNSRERELLQSCSQRAPAGLRLARQHAPERTEERRRKIHWRAAAWSNLCPAEEHFSDEADRSSPAHSHLVSVSRNLGRQAPHRSHPVSRGSTNNNAWRASLSLFRAVSGRFVPLLHGLPTLRYR